jgi:hypothetical protein
MSEIIFHQFDQIYSYLLDDELILKELHKEYGKNVLNEDVQDFVNIIDFLEDTLINNAQIYSEFEGNGDYGNFPIYIKGLGGIYFIEAPEFEKERYFIKLEDAEVYVKSDWIDLVSRNARRYRKPFERRDQFNLEESTSERSKQNFEFSIHEILKKPTQSGSFEIPKKFPSGISVKFSCSWSTRMFCLDMLGRYKNQFGETPDWLILCHPYHCVLLCKLAIKNSVKLPDIFENLEKYYV